MKRRRPHSESRSSEAEVTPEITGKDAGRDGAEPGNVGAGEPAGDPDDIEKHFRLEPDPAHPEDLPPDHLEETGSSPADDQEYTARPRKDFRPITPDQLP